MIPQILQKFEISKNSLEKCKFSNSNHFCATFDNQGVIYMIDFKNNNNINLLQGHHGSVLQVNFTKDSKYLLSIGEDKRLLKWVNFQHGYYEIIHHFPELMTHFNISKKQNDIFLCGKSGKIYKLQVDDKIDYLNFEMIQDVKSEICCSILTEDNQNIIIGTLKGQCYVIDLKKKQIFSIDCLDQKNKIICLSLHPDQCVLAICQQNSTITFYDLRSRNVQFSFQPDLIGINQIEFSMDKKYFYICSEDSSIIIRDLQTGKNSQILKISNQKINYFDISYNSFYLVSCTLEGNCILWQMQPNIDTQFQIQSSQIKTKLKKNQNPINSQKTQQKVNKIQENINRLLETVDLFNRVLQRNSDQLDQIEQHLLEDNNQQNQIKYISISDIPQETVQGSSYKVLSNFIDNYDVLCQKTTSKF